jgi:hypothetical protein
MRKTVPTLARLARFIFLTASILGAPRESVARVLALATSPAPASAPAAATTPPASPSASSAPASAPASASPSAVGEARAREGQDALDKGDFEAARLAFAQAYAVDAQPKYLWNLGLAESRGGHPLEALGHLRALAATWPQDASADDRRKLDALIAEDAARVGHVRVDAPAGTSVVIDGTRAAGVTPLPAPVDVAPGNHTLTARLGSRNASTVVAPGPGETVVWQLQFAPEAPATVPVPVRATPAAPVAEVRAPHKKAASERWIAAAGFVAGGLATAAIAGGFLAASSDQNSKWAVLNQTTGYCPQPPATGPCAALKNAADARATDENVAVGLGIASGALIVAGVVSFFVWPESHHDAPKASLAPIVGPNALGAQWSGRF